VAGTGWRVASLTVERLRPRRTGSRTAGAPARECTGARVPPPWRVRGDILPTGRSPAMAAGASPMAGLRRRPPAPSGLPATIARPASPRRGYPRANGGAPPRAFPLAPQVEVRRSPEAPGAPDRSGRHDPCSSQRKRRRGRRARVGRSADRRCRGSLEALLTRSRAWRQNRSASSSGERSDGLRATSRPARAHTTAIANSSAPMSTQRNRGPAAARARTVPPPSGGTAGAPAAGSAMHPAQVARQPTATGVARPPSHDSQRLGYHQRRTGRRAPGPRGGGRAGLPASPRRPPP